MAGAAGAAGVGRRGQVVAPHSLVAEPTQLHRGLQKRSETPRQSVRPRVGQRYAYYRLDKLARIRYSVLAVRTILPVRDILNTSITTVTVAVTTATAACGNTSMATIGHYIALHELVCGC